MEYSYEKIKIDGEEYTLDDFVKQGMSKESAKILFNNKKK